VARVDVIVDGADDLGGDVTRIRSGLPAQPGREQRHETRRRLRRSFGGRAAEHRARIQQAVEKLLVPDQ